MTILVLAGVGVISGLLSGYLGVGAAIVMIPLLTNFLAYDQKVAQSTSLTVMIPMALAGALMYRYRFHIAPTPTAAALLAAGAVAGSIAGSVLASISPARHLKLAFALFVIVSGLVLFVDALKGREA